jgi:glycosyltransferase involved in cell wall biosynthesis
MHTESMAKSLSIYQPSGEVQLPENPFGKDVANLELFRGLARHGGFERLAFLSLRPADESELARELLGGDASTLHLTSGSVLDQANAVEAGALLKANPDLYDLAWLRRRLVGDRAYSLVGLIHTIAPPLMRQMIAMAQVGPVHPWDAIICTSPSVRDSVEAMFDGWGDHLAERTGGAPPPRPALPVIPLGVDAAALAAQADRPEARARLRAQLGLGEGDILVLWVGRLSFFEKAFPQPMFRAVKQAADATGAKVHFAMSGWFPGELDRDRYEEAAQLHAPGVPVHFLDGNDRDQLGDLWAGADIFLSLVDNIQETFGITPLEAMAAGMPVVASDWDGYRSTIRDGIDGFLIPTLGGPAGPLGLTTLQRHILGATSYQSYVGEIAQHTAVNIGRAAAALANLIRSPDLRRRMGAAGRARVQADFDWSVVARAYQALLDELAEIRGSAPDPAPRRSDDPVRGDPFAVFAHFATQAQSLDMQISTRSGPEEVQALSGVLDQAFTGLQATPEECEQIIELIATGGARTVREVLVGFPVPRRRAVEFAIPWLAKLGLIDWLQ